ncbi:hypothetical protein K469DRAFT_748719, partial [Zopfia rhizophila CBS 207.26]
MAVLLVSASMNAVLVYRGLESKNMVADACVSEYAHLKRDLPQPFAIEGHENTTPDEEWRLPDPDTGTVALTDKYAVSKGLRKAQRWPWDFNKGIYFIQGYHNLHCLYMVRNSILEYRNNTPQTEHLLHIDHCLTSLRDDILCNADDTPRFTGGHFKQAGSGTNQYRMCRDWSKLDMWANARSGCYKTPVDPFDGVSTLERYKFCPGGGKPWIGAEIFKGVDPPDY